MVKLKHYDVWDNVELMCSCVASVVDIIVKGRIVKTISVAEAIKLLEAEIEPLSKCLNELRETNEGDRVEAKSW